MDTRGKNEELWTTAQAASYLNLPIRTLYNQRYLPEDKRGVKIPWVKLGRAVRYRRSDILRFVEEQVRQ